jgi:hypothetical protein
MPANVAGTFAYSPAAGALLPVGMQTLSVTFTPANTTTYNTASATVQITVNPAPGAGTSSTPVITWATPTAITNPAPLSATQLDATANVAGTFTYNPPAGTVLAPGTHTLAATFIPSNTTEYTTANATVSITVSAAAAGTSEFMYFGGSNLVSGIAISDGSVKAVPGSPYTVLPPGEVGFSMTGAGNLIYTYNSYASSSPLTGWSVDSQTGALTQEFSGSEIVDSVDPTFTYAYGPGPDEAQTSNISAYTINHSNGSLTQLSGSPYPLPTEIDGGVISSDGEWFCGTTFNGPGAVGMLICSPRNTTTAALGTSEISDANYSAPTPIAGSYFVTGLFGPSAPALEIIEPTTSGIKSTNPTPLCAGCSPISMAVSPAGWLVAVGVTTSTGNAILLYHFDSSSGTLAQLSEMPFENVPLGVRFSCDGAYLAAVHNADNMASVFSVSGSNLQELSGSPILLSKGTLGGGVVACP